MTIAHSHILVFLQFNCITINSMFYVYLQMIKLKTISFLMIGVKKLTDN